MASVLDKLEMQTEGLAMIREAKAKSSQLTSNMVGILTSFEDRLSKLEETIFPVYQESGNLQRKQENIEKTLVALDSVIGFYTVSREVEPIIREGPGQGLDTYLQALNRLEKALEYFEKNNPQSVELENVVSLFEAGRDGLNKEFKEVLIKHCKPIPPVALLDLISCDEEIHPKEMPSLSHFPSKVTQDLIQIADWLIVHNCDDYMNIYARYRASNLQRSLQALKEHQKSASGNSGTPTLTNNSPMAMPSPSTVSPSLVNQKGKPANRYDTPSRKTSKRIQQLLEKKANRMLMKASLTLEQSTGLALSSRRPTAGDTKEDHIEDHEILWFLTSFTAALKLLQSELQLMIGIIPLQHHKSVLSIIIKDALDSIFQDADSLSSRSKRSISRQDFGAVLSVFPILKHLVSLKPEWDTMLEGCDTSVRKKFHEVIKTFHETSGKALEELVEWVRNDNFTPLPKDGTVFELTLNILILLEQLADYGETLGPLLAQDPTYAQQLPPQLVSWPKLEKHKAVLGLYIKRVLVQLNLTLMTKSDAYSDVCLKALFRLNNNHYILKALQRAALLPLVKLLEPEAETIYLDMMAEQKRLYFQSTWAKVLTPMTVDDIPLTFLQGKLRDKDKNLIKDKFTVLNRELEDIAHQQRSYSVPDIELRESLKRDNKEYILPKYHSFYDKYSSVHFTKNADKYIKYSPAQVSSLIDTFFDVAA